MATSPATVKERCTEVRRVREAKRIADENEADSTHHPACSCRFCHPIPDSKGG